MTDRYAKGGQRFFRFFAILCVAAGLALALGMFRFSLHEAPGLPFLDQWEMMRELASGHGHYSLHQIWQTHNEHRIVLSKLLLLADFHLFRATGIVPIICIFIVQAIHCALFCLAACSLRDLSATLRIGICALILVFFFTPVHLADFLWPHEFAFVFPMFAGSLSLFLFSIGYETKGPQSRWAIGGCVLAAICSTISLASGVFLWPVLIMFCLVLRVPRRVLLTIAVSAAATLGVYFHNYHSPSAPFASIRHPGKMVAYLFAYLGGSWEVHGLSASIVVGLAGVCAALFFLFTRLARASSLTRHEVFSMLIITWTLTIAAATAAGRLYSGLDQALSGRYQSIGLVFWAALLLEWMIATKSWRAQLRSAAIPVLVFTIVAVGPLLKFNSLLERYAARTLMWRGTEAGALSDVNDRQFLGSVYPVPVSIDPTLEYLRQQRLAIFSSRLYSQLGSPFAAFYKIDTRVRCAGFATRVELLRNVIPSGFRFWGWAWNATSWSPLTRFVVVDDHGRISGFGAGGYRYNGILPPGVANDNAWVGYSRLESGAKRAQIYGILADSVGVCPVGAPLDVTAPLSSYKAGVDLLIPQLAKVRRGVFRAGQWLPNPEGLSNRSQLAFTFGVAGDTPIVGDWNGDGKLRIGVFRGGQWWVDMNGNGKWEASTDRMFVYGHPGDTPITGDWDGSGKLRIGVFRNGQWWVDINGDNRWDQRSDAEFTFGQAGDIPVVGDWDGKGNLRIGVFRAGQWWLDIDGDHKWMKGKDLMVLFGRPGDIPVVGNWDHVGKLRIGVFRRDKWFLDMNGDNAWGNQDDEIVQWGKPGDSPSLWGWPSVACSHSAASGIPQ